MGIDSKTTNNDSQTDGQLKENESNSRVEGLAGSLSSILGYYFKENSIKTNKVICMFVMRMREHLTGLKKDIETLQHSLKTAKQSVQELYNIMYKDTDSIINRMNITQARMDMITSDMKENRQYIEQNTRSIKQIAAIANKNNESLKRTAEKLDQDYEKRSKFYYALLVPVIIAILPTITNFFTINETGTDIQQIMQKLDRIEQNYE